MESADPEERQKQSSMEERESSICSRVFHWGIPSNETLLVSDQTPTDSSEVILLHIICALHCQYVSNQQLINISRSRSFYK